MSVIGSFIHLPAPIPTIALDSCPGFFAALYFGASDGALVSGIGHLVMSIVNGFPLGVLHLPVALGLGVAGAMIGLINRLRRPWSFLPALAAGIAIDTGPVMIVVPSLGWATTLSLVPFLLLASSVNAGVAGATDMGSRGRLPSWQPSLVPRSIRYAIFASSGSTRNESWLLAAIRRAG